MRALVAALALIVVGACSGSDSNALHLDGRPRFPDDEGVATVVTRTRIQLDGKRSYKVDEERFVSFSTYTAELEPMITRKGQYVQLGVRDGRAVWMAGVAAVIPTPQPAVYYIGRLKEVRDDGRAIFTDGTVLRVKKGVRAPSSSPSGGRVRAKIDPAQHRVIELVAN